jgi:hypothetical protein
MEALGRVVRATAASPGTPVFDAMLTTASHDQPGEGPLGGLARHVLLAVLEERGTRQSTQADSTR